MKKAPTVWIIAGLDPSGGAGVLADCCTLRALDVMPFAIVTTLTSQNGSEVTEVKALSPEFICNQVHALKKLGWPTVIKIGLLPNLAIIHCLLDLLKDFPGEIIYDPVMVSSTQQPLMDPIVLPPDWLRSISLLTPNISEAQKILNQQINNQKDMLKAAKALINLGIKQVVLKGGHFPGEWAEDLWTNGREFFWISLPRLPILKTHGMGCAFSSLISGFLALNHDHLDAIVLAKMLLQQGLKQAYYTNQNVAFICIKAWPIETLTLPRFSIVSYAQQSQAPFLPCSVTLGLYTIINSVDRLKQMIKLGVKTIQLRIKNQSMAHCRREIQAAVALAKKQDIQLFINDYWELAIEFQAYGVHLGYEDLVGCDLNAIKQAGLRLGLSTHCYAELAQAETLQPSYIALGPIYPTTSKVMRFGPQGLEQLKRWRKLVHRPLVAIGGITPENVEEVLACGVEGVAVMSHYEKADL